MKKSKIIIKELEAYVVIGVKPRERLRPQKLLIDVTLDIDLSGAAASDEITDTVDYGRLAKEITAFTSKSNNFLLEKLAWEIANLCKAKNHIDSVTVEVKKPDGIKNAHYASVVVSL